MEFNGHNYDTYRVVNVVVVSVTLAVWWPFILLSASFNLNCNQIWKWQKLKNWFEMEIPYDKFWTFENNWIGSLTSDSWHDNSKLCIVIKQKRTTPIVLLWSSFKFKILAQLGQDPNSPVDQIEQVSINSGHDFDCSFDNGLVHENGTTAGNVIQWPRNRCKSWLSTKGNV